MGPTGFVLFKSSTNVVTSCTWNIAEKNMKGLVIRKLICFQEFLKSKILYLFRFWLIYTNIYMGIHILRGTTMQKERNPKSML